MNTLMNIFECIKDMAVEVSLVIIVVLICRCLIKKASKSLAYFLWGVVALRLLCPNMIVSEFSLFQCTNLISEKIEEHINEKMNLQSSDLTSQILLEETSEATNQEEANSETAGKFSRTASSKVQDSEIANSETVSKTQTFDSKSVKTQMETTQKVSETLNAQQKNSLSSWQKAVTLWEGIKELLNTKFAMWIWLAGTVLMLGYGIISYLYLKRKLRFATKLKDNIYETNMIQSPFILGMIKAKIYLPYHLNSKEQEYILKHEQYHLKRKDYLVKILAFTLLGIYWFHPLVWLAFYYMNCDMEMSCDEKVLENESKAAKKEYSHLLLRFASVQKNYPKVSLSFGENDTRKRVKHILNYKKPVIGISAFAAVILVLVLCSCLTDAPKQEETTKQAVTQQKEVEKQAAMQMKEVARQAATQQEKVAKQVAQQEESSKQKAVEEQQKIEELQQKAVAQQEELAKQEEVEKQKAIEEQKIMETQVKEQEMKHALQESGISEAESTSWLKRFEQDGLDITADKNNQYLYQDYDQNGTMDLVIYSRIQDTDWTVGKVYGTLYLYMNNTLVYTKEKSLITHGIESFLSGDVDNDGSTELIYSIDTGGNGAAGSYEKEILKYHNNTIEVMKFPEDFSKKEYDGDIAGDVGYRLQTSYGKKKNQYLITCSSLEKTVEVVREYATYDDGTYFDTSHKEGKIVGGECRGYYGFEIIEKNGREYLTAKEYIYGEAGVADGIGEAVFTFDWNKKGVPSVVDFTVIPILN